MNEEILRLRRKKRGSAPRKKSFGAGTMTAPFFGYARRIGLTAMQRFTSRRFCLLATLLLMFTTMAGTAIENPGQGFNVSSPPDMFLKIIDVHR